ncbi:hypothetical protein AYJ56_14585 [Brucella anthropi]|nr:hypothetical protein AYJ56_14585 [Brucella anthropi]
MASVSFNVIRPKINSSGEIFVIEWTRLCAYIALAQSRTCLWVSADPRMVRNSVRYLDLTAPVDLLANRQIEDILKQRRCGPF